MLNAARALVYETVRDAWTTVQRIGITPADQEVRMRVIGTYVTAQAAQVVETVWTAGGASSIFVGHPLERRVRDAHVLTQNLAVGPTNYAVAGRLLMGA